MCGSHVVRLFIKYMISWADFLPWIALLKRLVAMQSKYMDLEGKCNMDHWTVTSQSLCSSDLCLVSLPKFSTYLGRGSWTAARAGRAEALLFSPWGRRKGLHFVFHSFFLFWFGYFRGDSCVKFFGWLICSSWSTNDLGGSTEYFLLVWMEQSSPCACLWFWRALFLVRFFALLCSWFACWVSQRKGVGRDYRTPRL